jgi:hypothetical protein
MPVPVVAGHADLVDSAGFCAEAVEVGVLALVAAHRTIAIDRRERYRELGQDSAEGLGKVLVALPIFPTSASPVRTVR